MRNRTFSRNGLYLLAACVCLFLLNLYFVRDSESADGYAPQPLCQPGASNQHAKDNQKSNSGADSLPQSQSCNADGDELSCLKDETDIYFPFSFLRKRFDLTGKYSKDNSLFEWSTSYARVKVPDFSSYSPTGEFGHFASYSVETRDRVRCINAETGVPMSTQWDTTPYYYPIQIAQYGLQHYSRNISGFNSSSITLGNEHRDWQGSASSLYESSARTYFVDPDTGRDCVNISTGPQLNNAGVYLYLKEDPSLHIVTFKWRPQGNASFTFLVKSRETNSLILLNYVFEEDPHCVSTDNVSSVGGQYSFSYSLGTFSEGWYTVSRDILVDTARAMSTIGGGKKKANNIIYHPGDLKYVSVGFRGEATIEQKVIQTNEQHRGFFLNAADWALRTQDKEGGWPVPVERSIADRKLVLAAGWYSAMAQGHMMSLLVRAHYLTKNEEYLMTAIRGLDLFEKSVSDGGIRNDFLHMHPWFEEYPTTPGSFVLNGFMYSIIGLYDLSKAECVQENTNCTAGAMRASHLFSDGLNSLLSLLPLFDTGSGSIYDLRHVGLRTAPNLARWDYHAVHVYLLEWLHLITGNDSLKEIAKRWTGYARGNRAKHN